MIIDFSDCMAIFIGRLAFISIIPVLITLSIAVWSPHVGFNEGLVALTL